MTLRKPIGHRCFAALIAWCLLVTMLPVEPASAEEWIPAGSGGVITAGAPLAVRAAPGWDAAVAYEIADGSAVTIWDGVQAAPDGSLWYSVDGGFVPVDAVSSVAFQDSDVVLYQDAAPDASTQDAATDDGVAPATADPAAADGVAPATTETVSALTSKEALAAPAGAVDPTTGGVGTDSGAVDPASLAGDVDPTASKGVDPTTTGSEATDGSIDPATGEWIEPAAVDVVPVAPAPSAAPAPVTTLGTGGTEPWGEPIATAYIAGTRGDGAPCLTAPDWGSDTLTVLGEGDAVPVRAETMGEWQPVDCADAGGYVHTSLIAWTPMAAPEEADDGGRREREASDSGGASDGDKIVEFAMRYEGHPYVYAGEGPRAFDCSGFTMFVIQRTLGIDITHDMFVQYDLGSQVGRNALQPGDLVFFKNTFRRGLSHTGIYIGDGHFIHAENESTGVRISELASEYYSARWYGAVRYA